MAFRTAAGGKLSVRRDGGRVVRTWWRSLGLFSAGLMILTMLAANPARAIGINTCTDKVTGSVSLSTSAIDLGQPLAIRWSTQWQLGCRPSTLRLFYRDETSGVVTGDKSGTVVSPSGSFSDQPQSTGSYELQALVNGWTIGLGSQRVQVRLPAVGTRTEVDIDRPNQNGTFAQAIATQGALVRIAGTLDLDLSGMSFLQVASEVEIIGDHTEARAGPRLFTTSFPPVLLVVGGLSFVADDVRITGIRLDGGESDDPFSAVGQSDSDGISVLSSQHIEIDHNEISRWRGAAVSVHDGSTNQDFANRINRANADTVWVHDNFIHHNQHPSSSICGSSALEGGGHAAGYGVEVADGAYALIERNVFDWNRHAIAGDGKPGTGYLAERNLVLQHGGVHFRCVTSTGEIIGLVLNPFAGAVYLLARNLDSDSIYHTHAIDMHAVNTCHNGVFVGDGPDLGDHNCGPAGEFMDVEFNTVLYTAGNAIHLRGAPSVGMDVKHNVFAHSSHDGSALDPGAMVQNETGLRDSDNLFGLDTFDERKTCDFDGDGVGDPFIATGVTWWFGSSALGGRWVFLNQSPIRVADVTLVDVDGDGRCDETAGGQVFLNPDPQPFARAPIDIVVIAGSPVTVNLVATGGTRPYTWQVSGLPAGLAADSAGHVWGIPAGSRVSDFPVSATVTAANGQRSRVNFTWTVSARVPDLTGLDRRDAQFALTPAGLVLGSERTVYDCTDPPGTVIGQNPAAQQVAPEGTPVGISTSSLSDGKGHHCHLN
jgi:hypothetical protein